jgi:hypothetical protein
MVTVDTREFRKLEKDLRTFASKAIPHAVRNSLSTSAFQARAEWQDQIKRSFTLRNKFTERSIRVEKATGFEVRRMVSVVGSVAPYMERQEFGGIEHANRGIKAIPGPSAAGQAPGTKRTRLVRATARLGRINVKRGALRRTGGSPKQRNLVALLQARRAGRKHALLERKNGGRGLFLITGTKRKIRTRLLYDVSKSQVTVPAEPTLQRTLKAIEPKLERIHKDAFLFQLRKHRILGY